MHQMLQNLEDSLGSVLNFPCQIMSNYCISLRLHYSGSTGELQNAMPLPTGDFQRTPINSNG